MCDYIFLSFIHSFIRIIRERRISVRLSHQHILLTTASSSFRVVSTREDVHCSRVCSLAHDAISSGKHMSLVVVVVVVFLSVIVVVVLQILIFSVVAASLLHGASRNETEDRRKAAEDEEKDDNDDKGGEEGEEEEEEKNLHRERKKNF